MALCIGELEVVQNACWSCRAIPSPVCSYMIKTRLIWAVLQYAVSLSWKQGPVVWNGLQRKSFKVKLEGRVHWEWLTNFLCFQVQPDSGRIEHEGNRRFHKSSIRKSTQVELHSRLACASKGAANIVTGSTDHRKVCTVLSVLLCSTYPN